ncbi:hypothetical protein [Thiobacillus sp.]
MSDPIFVFKELVIRLGSKNYLAIIAALDDVLRLAGNHVAGKTCHERSCGNEGQAGG